MLFQVQNKKCHTVSEAFARLFCSSTSKLQGVFLNVLYHSDATNILVHAVVQNDNTWVTQKAMSDLFAVNTPAISKYLKNIYDDGELDENLTISKMEIVKTDCP